MYFLIDKNALQSSQGKQNNKEQSLYTENIYENMQGVVDQQISMWEHFYFFLVPNFRGHFQMESG